MVSDEPQPSGDEPLEIKKSKALRRAITISISIIVLLVVLVGAGIAYTYYFGATPTTQTLQAAPKPQINAVAKPAEPADDAKVGVSIESFTTPVKPGDNSFISIKTLPTAACTIDVEYNKVKSTDTGLVQKKADEYGVVSWSWTVGTATPEGSWPVVVTCAHGSQSGTVTGTLVVSKTAGDE